MMKKRISNTRTSWIDRHNPWIECSNFNVLEHEHTALHTNTPLSLQTLHYLLRVGELFEYAAKRACVGRPKITRYNSRYFSSAQQRVATILNDSVFMSLDDIPFTLSQAYIDANLILKRR